MRRSRGFTLIEVITAIAIIGIIMIPIAMIMMEYVRSTAWADSLTMAANLARREIGIINSTSYSGASLANGYNNLSQNYAGYKYDLRRAVSSVPGTGDNLRLVSVKVFSTGTTDQFIELDTYVMDKNFGIGSAGVGAGYENTWFSASGGTTSKKEISGITLTSTKPAGNITMTGVIITSSVNRNLTNIQMNTEDVFSGTVSLSLGVPTQVTFDKNFIMNAGTTYSGGNGGTFSLSSEKVYTVTIIFLFFDGTQSAPYIWSYS